MYTFVFHFCENTISCKHIENLKKKKTYVQNTNEKIEDTEGVIISRVIEEGRGRKDKHWSTTTEKTALTAFPSGAH